MKEKVFERTLRKPLIVNDIPHESFRENGVAIFGMEGRA